MSKMIKIATCQCQNCIYCHGGGCGDEPDFVIRFKEHNRKAEIAVCEMCGVSLLGTHPDVFEKVERD
jgi:hypothetical protein